MATPTSSGEGFGEWLIKLREDVGYETTQKAADAIGISRAQLYRWENGRSRPGVENLTAIADAYRIDATEVARRAGYPVNNPTGISEWAESLARRIERRTANLPESRRQAVERAVDSLLTATAA